MAVYPSSGSPPGFEAQGFHIVNVSYGTEVFLSTGIESAKLDYL